jgi:tRNA A-37 threonylcarbamoyl transferase component Bud32
MTAPLDLEQQLRAALGASYDITREIAGGGMSRVFVATEKTLDRPVVIKLLAPELAAGVNRERFQREIQLAAKLQHPHIVPLFSTGAVGNLLYYTMPFISGESLKHALASGRRYTVREAVRIIRDVADALAYAHAAGIAHRDIKPGNVLQSGGHSLVTDFGVAKALNVSLPGVAMTASGMAIGTPAYMAPEQLAGDPAADHRVDVYALGLLAYELFTGSNPFSGPSPQATLASQLTREPERLNVRRPEIPLALSTLIARCLAKAPEQRPQTAAQVVAELDALSSGDFLPAGQARSKRGWMISAGVLAAAALIALVVVSTRTTPPVIPAAPAAAVPQATPPLSGADSLAIAKAVERKMAALQKARPAAPTKSHADSAPARTAGPVSVPAPAPTPAQMQAANDSLRAEVFRAVMDSVTKLQQQREQEQRATLLPPGRGRPGGPEGLSYSFRGPFDSSRNYRVNPLSPQAFAERAQNMGPPRRVVVSDPRPVRNQPEVNAAAARIMDSVRRALEKDARYVVIPPESVGQVLTNTRMIDSVAKRLNADLFLSLTPVMLRNGVLQWQLAARDLSANSAYRERVVPVHVHIDSLLALTDSLVLKGLQSLHEIDRAPRRPPPGTNVRPPDTTGGRGRDGGHNLPES